MGKYFIQPYNEGQELNYVETFKGTLKQAKMRAKTMERILKRILKQGIITVDVSG